MKSGRVLWVLAVLGMFSVGFSGHGFAWAGSDGLPPASAGSKTSEPLPDYQKMSVDELANDPVVSRRYKNVLKRVMKRREFVTNNLGLSDEQKEKVLPLFEQKLEQLAGIIRKGQAVWAPQRERLADLAEQFSDAKLHHQGARAMSLYKEVYKSDPGPQHAFKAFLGFDSRIRNELGRDKGKQYMLHLRDIDKKLIDLPKPAGFSPVRFVLDEIGISEQQQRKVLEINKALSKSISEAHVNRDYERMAEVEGEFRRRCLAILTDDQLKAYLEKEKKHEVEDGWKFSK